MKVNTEDIGNCQLALSIEAEAAELDKSLNEAYHHLVKEVSVPGFRKGKTPRAILEQHIGRHRLLEEALEHLIPQLYKQAVASQQLEPISEPQVEVTQAEPLTFKAIVSLKPKVSLGNYQDIRLEPAPQVEITDKEVAAALEEWRERRGAWVPTDRPAQLGDLVTMNIRANAEGKPWLNHKDILYEMDKNSWSPVPGFALPLEGIEKGKPRAFSLTIPDDYPVREMRGKEASFEVTVSEVKEKQLPELDDQFAVSAGYANLEEMRKKVTDDLRARAEVRSGADSKQKALDALVEMSEVTYAPVLEDKEIDALLRSEAQRMGFRETSDYLKRTNKTEEEIKQQLRPLAKKRLTQGLALGKLAEEEKIEISASEVDNKIEEIASNAEDREKAKQLFSLPQFRQSIEQSLRTEKTLDKLLEIATGDSRKIAKGE